jgi:hypothetical protein
MAATMSDNRREGWPTTALILLCALSGMIGVLICSFAHH